MEHCVHNNCLKSMIPLAKLKGFQDEIDIPEILEYKCNACSNRPTCKLSAQSKTISLQESFKQEVIKNGTHGRQSSQSLGGPPLHQGTSGVSDEEVLWTQQLQPGFQGPPGPVRNKSASVSKANMDTVSVGLDDIERVLDWSVRYEKDKVMITSVLDGLEVLFNQYTGKVDNSTGRRHFVCVPDVSILTLAEDIRRSIKPPELVETAGLKRVKTDRGVYVDPIDRKFRRSTGELAPGYGDLV